MYNGRIENWKELDLLGVKRIVGDIYESTNPDKLPNGEEMFTSAIVKYHTDLDPDGTVVETRSGSMYLLGKPSTDTRTAQDVFADASKNTMEETIH